MVYRYIFMCTIYKVEEMLPETIKVVKNNINYAKTSS